MMINLAQLILLQHLWLFEQRMRYDEVSCSKLTIAGVDCAWIYQLPLWIWTYLSIKSHFDFCLSVHLDRFAEGLEISRETMKNDWACCSSAHFLLTFAFKEPRYHRQCLTIHCKASYFLSLCKDSIVAAASNLSSAHEIFLFQRGSRMPLYFGTCWLFGWC